MTSSEIRAKYLRFFEKRGHAVVLSSSLIPEKDATTLFTGSGMQPLLPYLLGGPHPAGTRVADSQKCFRAEDIEEVGDNRHTTFFEMLGNWSFGDYFKQEQLQWFFEFLTSEVGLDPKRLYITVFSGDEKYGVPKDEESAGIWKKLFSEKGIEAETVEIGNAENGRKIGMRGNLPAGKLGKIFYYDAGKNWWSRAGTPEKMPAREPGGPDSEVFYDFHPNLGERCLVPGFGDFCHPNCDCGRFMEIGNSVFMEYLKKEDGTFEKLKQKNVDFGGGLERIAAASNDDEDIFNIDAFRAMRATLEEAGLKIAGPEDAKRMRIVLDHVRAGVFLIGDGVAPSNKDQGYVLRRLMRRSIIHAHLLELAESWLENAADAVIRFYEPVYPGLAAQKEAIASIMSVEYRKFSVTLDKGLQEFKKHKSLGPEEVFDLHQSYGFPFELTKELVKERGGTVDEAAFEEAFRRHQEISRAGQEKKFGGHGLYLKTGEVTIRDQSEVEKVTRLHTATHLLHQALRETLGPEVRQSGSDITVERTRLDFSFPRKLTPEELKRVENLVNEKIGDDLRVDFAELPKKEAEKTGALYFFKERYPDRVKVYFMGPTLETAWSKEFCGGPHVAHTAEVGKFRIIKEEAVGSGVRRIRGSVD